jgi:hypothetical protein
MCARAQFGSLDQSFGQNYQAGVDGDAYLCHHDQKTPPSPTP